MSPDSQQPQNSSPLPEVPPLAPEAQPPQPVAYPEQPAVIPVAPPAPQPQPVAVPAPVTPVANPFGSPAPTSNATQFQQAPFPGATSVASQPGGAPLTMPQPKKKLGLLIGLIAGGVVVLGGLAAVLLIFLAPSGKIAESDLVSASLEDTSFMRPKQWESVTIDSNSGYGDKKGKDGESNAYIVAKKGTYVQSGIKDATDSQLETFRSSIVDQMSTSDATESMKKSDECTEVKDVKVEQSSIETTNLVGIMRISATCVRDDGSATAIMYIGLGDDGYLRSVMVVASESLWKQNEAVFNKMLDSVDQS